MNQRGTESSGDREREKERPIVRSMREEIGDSISTQMSRGQIFPGSRPWGLGCLWDTASGDSLPNKTRETGRKREKDRYRDRIDEKRRGWYMSASKAVREREKERERE